VTPTEHLAVALLEQYGANAVARMLDDAENGLAGRVPGPADVPADIRARALYMLGSYEAGWRSLVRPIEVCRPTVRAK
jgi:hypothetical protein|tara:strand:+ start:258 stop:491 length:234 start_codon:yes stop_codon:yes gene_type:complete